jgi:hypothetical protein
MNNQVKITPHFSSSNPVNGFSKKQYSLSDEVKKMSTQANSKQLDDQDNLDLQIAQLLFNPLFKNIAEPQRRLMRTSILLYQEERRQGARYPDYTFVVFSMSKAYEGFLKEYLFQMELISINELTDRRFRIGRALNPDVSKSHRDEQWYYDDLARVCSPALSRLLWNTWLECRNRLFHYFPDSVSSISLQQAGKYLLMIADTMDQALVCYKNNT